MCREAVRRELQARCCPAGSSGVASQDGCKILMQHDERAAKERVAKLTKPQKISILSHFQQLTGSRCLTVAARVAQYADPLSSPLFLGMSVTSGPNPTVRINRSTILTLRRWVGARKTKSPASRQLDLE